MNQFTNTEVTGRSNRFMSWKDLVVTPMVETVILALSFFTVLFINRAISVSLLTNALAFYIAMIVWTIIFLKIIRTVFPIKEGIYSYNEKPLACYIWNLYTFLSIVNLNLLDRKSTRLNSSHRTISYAVFCLKKKTPRVRFARSVRLRSTRPRRRTGRRRRVRRCASLRAILIVSRRISSSWSAPKVEKSWPTSA